MSEKIQKILKVKPIVLIGLMGCGKTTLGRRLADQLKVPFFDSDFEIEKAAGLSITEIFATHGETAFREAEEKVIRRLLEGPHCILATGGGAFMREETRKLIKETSLSIWINADLDLLMQRVLKKPTRPLLQNENPRAVMASLMEIRYPIYAEADIEIQSQNIGKEEMMNTIIKAIEEYDTPLS